ncbi:transient receptor potential cation channel subfamily M member 4-like isoform X2 [Montipora foliosa]|uniref:transient receptor potential cation channel subfamily M member 4-like isoform X2 n=1 Tax=Montipora foliosa TaxID=591990 RepID=UPI0035F1AF6A
MKVSFKLREKAKRKGPDNERFNHLANSVEEFVFCFLDPLRPGAKKEERQQFGEYVLDDIFHDAVDFQQKKFFTHPVVHEEMHRKWHGFDTELEKQNCWKAILSIVCVFDLFFSLLLFVGFSFLNRLKKGRNKPKSSNCGSDAHNDEPNSNLNEDEERPINASQIERSKTAIGECYLKKLEIPYLKFVRDTLSYIVLLGLQCVLCVVPSTIKFSILEWVILVFFFGRLLVECKQFVGTRRRLKQRRADGRAESCNITCKALQIYFGNCWNRLDFFILFFYSAIFMLRLYVAVWSRQLKNNYPLIISSYLYGVNALCLSFRVFGHIVEQFQEVGTTQTALFSILRDIRVVLGHFLLAIVSFSFALTKVYVDERSFGDGGAHDHACMNKGGIFCWWKMFVHLVLSIVGIPEFDKMDFSMDTLSDTVLLVKYAIFLVLGIILLKNMLISVLSHTYQQTKDNSIQEWAYKRALTIETCNDYDPIPVPLNIIYFLGECIKCMYNKTIRCTEESPQSCQCSPIITHRIEDLENKYFAKYKNSFPLIGETKLDRVLDETKRSRQMATQIICSSFKSRENDHRIPLRGPKAWSFDSDFIHVEGHLMSCKCRPNTRHPCRLEKCYHGATYYSPLCPSFPHFEVTILETGRTHWPGIGVVPTGYSETVMPGWEKQSLGYHTDDGKIYHSSAQLRYDYFGHDTEGHRMARRGDLIRCTAMFEHQANGKVPICFTLNGEKIVTTGDPTSSFSVPCSSLYPYLALSDGCSVLVKICCEENEEYNAAKFAEIKKELEETNRKLEETNLKVEETNLKLDKIMGFIADLRQGESFPVA